MTSKVCFKCQCEKPLGDFYRHSEMADGHLNKCKQCTKIDVAKHRSENLENIRAYDKFRSNLPHRVAMRNQVVAKYEEKFPNRKHAVVTLNNAVRDRRVMRQPCWVCGEKAVAHHPDYSRPLDVVWLCQAHHKQTHALATNHAHK